MNTQAQSKKYGGRLENWYIVMDRVHGNLYNDPNNRFPEGKEVLTSSIVYGEETYLETENTIYDLGVPYEAS